MSIGSRLAAAATLALPGAALAKGGGSGDGIVVTPGWTYVITADGEGAASKVAVTFTQTATGKRIGAGVEFGKTRIGQPKVASGVVARRAG